jgi:hypothetical protein
VVARRLRASLRLGRVVRCAAVSAPRIELEPHTPRVLRLFDRVPLPAFWVGVAIALAVLAVFVAYTALLGAGPGRLRDLAFERHLLAELQQDLFLGFTLAIAAASVRGARRDVEALLPALDPAGRGAEALRRTALTWRPGLLGWMAVAAGTFSGLSTPTDPALWSGGAFPGWSHPTALWLGARNFANWWAVAFAMGLELMLGSAFSRLGDHLREVDLLDRTPLAPFGRRALRNVSFWMLLAAFLALTYAGRGWAGSLLPLALLSLAAFAIAAFLLPLWGAHRRLREAKAAELASVRGAIRAARGRALADPGGAGAPGGRLADLLAWEARVADAAEWPIDASVRLRLVLYLALGLGSWVGAALVQRFVDTALR